MEKRGIKFNVKFWHFITIVVGSDYRIPHLTSKSFKQQFASMFARMVSADLPLEMKWPFALLSGPRSRPLRSITEASVERSKAV